VRPPSAATPTPTSIDCIATTTVSSSALGSLAAGRWGMVGDWPALYERWKDWAAGLTGEAAAAEVSYRDMRGNPWRQPLGQLVLHAVNHGTHHRGQVSGFLRAMGHTPPKLDLVLYYRESVEQTSRSARVLQNPQSGPASLPT